MKQFSNIAVIFFFLFTGISLLFIHCRKDSPVPKKKYPGWTVYDTHNSGLTTNGTGGIIMDRLSNVWTTSGTDLIKFDGITWERISPPSNDLLAFVAGGFSGIGMGDYIWFCGHDGLYKMNIFDHNFQVYTQFNSGLPSNVCSFLAADTINNILWIGTANGLARFNGINWQVFNNTNSPMTANEVHGLAIDKNGKIWMTIKRWPLSTTDTSAYVMFDEQNSIWNVFNTTNAQFHIAGAWDIQVDNNNSIWFTGIDIDQYSQGNWVHYNSTNTPKIPDDQVTHMAMDNEGKIWMATLYSGIVTYENGLWEYLTTENSGLPSYKINYISARSDGEIWISTADGGIAVYKKP